MSYPDPFPHKTYRAGSCPDPTPREQRAGRDEIPETTQLGLHLLSEHRLGNAHLLTPREQIDIHGDEHAGPGTIRNHPPAARNWSLAKVRETLSGMEEPASCPAHGAHPHGGATCLDCPTCRPAGGTNAEFAELTVMFGALMLRVAGCNCGGPYDVAGDPHRAGCGWEPVVALADLDAILPSLPARLAREFHEVFELPIDDVSRTTNDFRAKLIREEANEAAEAVTAPLAHTDAGRAHTAKELADAVIALYGTAVTTGIDLDMAVRLVHRSNMSKVDADGKPIIREDGKVMKGPNYREPDMTAALRPLRSET